MLGAWWEEEEEEEGGLGGRWWKEEGHAHYPVEGGAEGEVKDRLACSELSLQAPAEAR